MGRVPHPLPFAYIIGRERMGLANPAKRKRRDGVNTLRVRFLPIERTAASAAINSHVFRRAPVRKPVHLPVAANPQRDQQYTSQTAGRGEDDTQVSPEL